MLCIHNTQTDPYFNLAAEEYLLKNFKENIFMLWQNEKKEQNTKTKGRGETQIILGRRWRSPKNNRKNWSS